MKTLDRYNAERAASYEIQREAKFVYNGIECPQCGHELVDSTPQLILPSYPPKKDVACPDCGFTGYRIA